MVSETDARSIISYMNTDRKCMEPKIKVTKYYWFIYLRLRLFYLFHFRKCHTCVQMVIIVIPGVQPAK